MTEQLQLDIDRACARLADRLKDRAAGRHDVAIGGAERLLRDLVRRTDLNERALLPAAALVIALELDTARKTSAIRTSARTPERVTASATSAGGWEASA